MDRYVVLECLRRLGFDLSKVNTSKNNIMVSCIEHRDNSPSCSINLEKGIYHCFSCEKSGTLPSLYFEHFGKSIYRELEITLDKPNSFISGFDDFRNKKIDYDLTPDAFVHYEGDAVKAWSSVQCRRYLESRGITQKVSEDMNMWFSIEGKVIDLQNDDVTDNFVAYKNRLMIPIRESGQTLSIEGRDILGKDKYTGENYKKVLYPKGSSTSTLFQLERLNKLKDLYIVEGLMDLGILRTSEHFKNSTTVFGASISHRQVHLLNRFNKIVFIIDNDLPGWTSLLKLGKNLDLLEKNAHTKLFYIVPPKGAKDTGEIWQKLSMTIDECYDRNGFSREYAWNESFIKDHIKNMEPKPSSFDDEDK